MDRYMLAYEMKSKGITAEKLCKSIGMSKSAYYRKLNGKSEFTQGEIQKICNLLDLKSPMGIFFAETVS